MDETDLIILRKLLDDSRMTYRELAELTDMALSTIHKRINKLIEDEVILGFIARPSMIALKSLLVTIFGTSNAKSLNTVSKELGQNENVVSVAIASGKMMYISGFLRDISALRDHSAYVSKTAEMSEPTVGIIDVPYTTFPEPLTSIDFKILKSLNKDSRKPVTDIADDIGLSTKTVKKRLDRMIENNLVEFSIEWSDRAENNLTTGFHIHLKEGTDINSISQYLFEKYNENTIACISFSNIPNFIIMFTWTRNTQESHEIQEKLQTEGFRDVIPHLIISTDYYDCWVDKLLRSK
ncbi:MAG: winged helix-turn-helix transcriptional regulator [Candidatus Hodarchaeota archaeon]